MSLSADYRTASKLRQAFVFWWADYAPSISLSSSNDVAINVQRSESKPHDVAISVQRSESKSHDIRMMIYRPLETSNDILMNVRVAETVTD